MIDYVAQGRSDRRAGKKLFLDNPHDHATCAFYAWRNGWLDEDMDIGMEAARQHQLSKPFEDRNFE